MFVYTFNNLCVNITLNCVTSLKEHISGATDGQESDEESDKAS